MGHARRAALLIAFFCAAGAGGASTGASGAPNDAGAPPLSGAPAAQDTGTTYVVRRGWHIDVGFAVADLEPPLEPIAARFPGARYLFFGFGDRRYLLAKHRNAPVLLAALWPGSGMLLVTALVSSPDEAFGSAHVIALPEARVRVRDMQRFIRGSIAGDDSPIPYGPGPYEGSLYFTAVARYSAVHTCNTWAAETLQAGRLPIHSAGVVFAGQVWSQVRRLDHRPAEASPR